MKAKRKADLLAERLAAPEVGAEEPSSPQSGAVEAELESLQLLARRLAATRLPELSSEAQVAGLVRVRETLHERRAARSRRGVWMWRLARTVLAVFLVLLFTATGTVWAAGGSLPGQVLYPLKRQVETARLSLTWRPFARSILLLSYANRRLDEVQAVCPSGNCPAGLLSDLETNVQEAETTIEQLPPGERTVPLEGMYRLTGRTEEILMQIIERAPAELRPALEVILERFRNRHNWADDALKQGRPAPTVTPTPSRRPTATWTPAVIPTNEPLEHWPAGIQPTDTPEPTAKPRRTSTPLPSPIPSTEPPTTTATLGPTLEPVSTPESPRLPPPTPTPTSPRLPPQTLTPVPPTSTPYPYP